MCKRCVVLVSVMLLLGVGCSDDDTGSSTKKEESKDMSMVQADMAQVTQDMAMQVKQANVMLVQVGPSFISTTQTGMMDLEVVLSFDVTNAPAKPTSMVVSTMVEGVDREVFNGVVEAVADAGTPDKYSVNVSVKATAFSGAPAGEYGFTYSLTDENGGVSSSTTTSFLKFQITEG